MTGQNFPSKVLEYWSFWFENPKERFKIAKSTNKVLLKLLPEIRSFKDPKMILEEFQNFTEFVSPDFLMQKFLNDSYEKSLNLNKILEKDQFILEEKRAEIFGKIF